MSIKTVNSLSHYTDWTVGHVHAGALGWVAMISVGSIYCDVAAPAGPAGDVFDQGDRPHFWLHTIGVVLYIASMWIAGVMQGLMWRATNADGTLTYSFVEALKRTYPYYLGRLAGGLLVLAGMCVMAWNVVRTWQLASDLASARRCLRPARAPIAARAAAPEDAMSHSHEKIETNIGLMAMLIAVAVISFGGLAEIVPLMYQAEAIEPLPGVKPYPALQLAGRDVYVREGCYNCHSQMVRTLRFETERYGHYSLAGESVYDRPFQWGSKRTGPDLARVGGRYSDDWHRVHLINPRDVVPESNMPGFPWLAQNRRRHRRSCSRHARAASARRSLHRRRDRRARAPRSPARPNWMRWSPTCRAWASTHRGEADMIAGIVTAMLLGAVPRRLAPGCGARAASPSSTRPRNCRCRTSTRTKRRRSDDAAALVVVGDRASSR